MSNIWDRERLLRSTILAGFAAAGLAISPAYAQDNQDDEEQAEEGDEERIVVTGSRIRRDSFTSVAPLQVIDAEEIRDAGLIDTASILQQTTVAQGVQLDNTITSSFVTDGGPGANNVSLRGLNPDQTLVLINGRRLAPAGVEGAPALVDVNIVPASMIQRLDVLLDGASSVYGSDAIAGVVNIVLRDNFEGFQVLAAATMPEEDGGGSHNASFMVGDSSQNGSFMFAAQYFHQDELEVQDRDYNYSATDGLYCSRDIEIGPDGQRFDSCEGSIINRIRTFSAYVDGSFDFSNYSPLTWGRDAYSTPGTTDLPGLLPSGWSNGGADAGARFDLSQGRNARSSYLEGADDVIPESQRYSMLFTGDYTLDRFLWQENVTFFTEMLHSNTQAQVRSGYHGQLFPTVNASNAFNPFGYDVVPIIASPINRSDITTEIQYTRLNGGFAGDWSFAPSWGYEFFAGYTRSMGWSSRPAVDNDRMAYSIATSRPDGAGGVTCGGSDTQQFTIFGFLDPVPCVPVNMFARSLYPTDGVTRPQFATQEELDYLTIDRTASTVVDQVIVGGFTTGPLFELPAGTVNAVVGFEWRDDSLDSRVDTVTGQGRAAGFFADRRSIGSASLSEYFAEIAIPVLSGVPLAEDVQLEVAGRLTDHEFYGQNSTYSAKLGWTVNDFLTFNATAGSSFRAPNLRELFLGGQTGFSSGFNDPCVVPLGARDANNNYDPSSDPREEPVFTNCQSEGVDPFSLGLGTGVSSIEAFRAGNPGLDPETSDAFSVGFVFDQPFFDSFDASLRVSYWSIEVEDSIAIPGTGFSLNECYTSTNFPNNPFCARRQRDPNTGFLLFVDNTPFNVSTQEATGFDYNARFNKDFDFFGGFNLDVNSIWTQSDRIRTQTTSESDVLEFVGDWGNPEWRGTTNAVFTRGDYSLRWRGRYVGEQASISNIIIPADPSADPNYGERLIPAGESNNVPQCNTNSSAFDATYCSGVEGISSQDGTWYQDLSLRWSGGDGSLDVIVGINNLFDEDPAITDQNASGDTQSSGNAVLGSGYDLLGRRFFISIGKRW